MDVFIHVFFFFLESWAMDNSKRSTFFISWAFIDYWLWPNTAPPAGVLTGLQNCCCLPEEMWEPLDQVSPPAFVSTNNVVFFIVLRQKSLKKCLQQKRRRWTSQCHFKAWGFCAGKMLPAWLNLCQVVCLDCGSLADNNHKQDVSPRHSNWEDLLWLQKGPETRQRSKVL